MKAKKKRKWNFNKKNTYVKTLTGAIDSFEKVGGRKSCSTRNSMGFSTKYPLSSLNKLLAFTGSLECNLGVD